jgi:hypothetical protein
LRGRREQNTPLSACARQEAFNYLFSEMFAEDKDGYGLNDSREAGSGVERSVSVFGFRPEVFGAGG